MIEAQSTAEPEWPDSEPLSDALKRGENALLHSAPILSYLLSTRDQSLFSDEIVARVRGMLLSLADQILRIQAEATGYKGAEQFASEHRVDLADHLATLHPLVSFSHALALEWQTASRLEARNALDPALSPLIQELVGSEDSAQASAAMAALAAQTRFMRSQARMELPLEELDGELFHDTLMAWRVFSDDAASDALSRAETKMRSDFEESGGRISLLSRVVASLADDADMALQLEQAGVSLFLTALADRSGLTRNQAAISLNEGQSARLMLALRASGMRADFAEGLVLKLHPDAVPPRGLDEIGTREAAKMLTEIGRPAGN